MTILKQKKHQAKHITLWICIAYSPCAQIQSTEICHPLIAYFCRSTLETNRSLEALLLFSMSFILYLKSGGISFFKLSCNSDILLKVSPFI